MEKSKNTQMRADEYEIAEFRLAVLDATERICESILTNKQDIELSYQEFYVAMHELIDAVHYYQNMCNAFAQTNTSPAQDCEFLLDVLMIGDPLLTSSAETISAAVSLSLYGLYNRFYSAAIMLVGVAMQKFPNKQKAIKLVYSKLSPNCCVPKFTTPPQEPKISKQRKRPQDCPDWKEIQDGIK